MQVKIQNGAVDLSGERILSQIDFDVTTGGRVGIVGRNGCGKTTLLRVLSGELTLAEGQLIKAGHPEIGILRQIAFEDDNRTLVEEVRDAYRDLISQKGELARMQTQMENSSDENLIADYTALLERFTNAGGFYFEKEYEAALKHFGFTDEEKHRPLHEFSGGQRTKIAFLKLLLSKPDLLLLDEPTNHLDVEAVAWLETYLQNYPKAVALVSHDRMFLDRVVNCIYEIEHGKTHRYVGNYTKFVEQKKLVRAQQAKLYEAQQKEIARIEGVITRFQYKATKAAMAQSKIKQLDRMEKIENPESEDNRTFHVDISPTAQSVRDVLLTQNLTVGFDTPLATLSLDIKRGERVGIIGGNGLGKSTFLKTITRTIPPLSGEFYWGGGVAFGYFDQQMAQYRGNETVLDNYRTAYPADTDFEARSTLGAFQFSGEAVFKTLDMLSGGERVRLALCKLLRKRPNVLILDEPTNHMDIIGKETLEELLSEYEGTLIFVSHDRYFVNRLAERLLIFKENGVESFEGGYEDYLARQVKEVPEAPEKPTEKPRGKKNYTTPAKEQARRERALKKAEEQVAALEAQLEEIERQLCDPETATDYVKLSEIEEKRAETEEKLADAMGEWEAAADAMENKRGKK